MSKPKTVSVQVIPRESAGNVTGPYRIMESLIEAHHPHLTEAKIAIAWKFGWGADADGRITLGKCKKGSDLDRELHSFDFVILLNYEIWHSGTAFTEAQMHALIDHELCHAQVAIDAEGCPKVDERGRTVWRIRKHDVEEFREVVARHGEWKSNIEAFVRTTLESKKSHRPLLDQLEHAAEAVNGNGEADELVPIRRPRAVVKKGKKKAKAKR